MTNSKKPTHILTFSETKDGKSTFTTQIGAAWAREDGSFSLSVKLIPAVPGLLNLRPIRDTDAA